MGLQLTVCTGYLVGPVNPAPEPLDCVYLPRRTCCPCTRTTCFTTSEMLLTQREVLSAAAVARLTSAARWSALVVGGACADSIWLVADMTMAGLVEAMRGETRRVSGSCLRDSALRVGCGPGGCGHHIMSAHQHQKELQQHHKETCLN